MTTMVLTDGDGVILRLVTGEAGEVAAALSDADPADLFAVPADTDPLTQRVDRATGDLVAYDRPAIRTVPVEVSRRLLIKAMQDSPLTANGVPLWDVETGAGAVPAYLDALPVGLRQQWDAASVIERADPLIEAARVALGLSETEVDDLFRCAV